MLHEKVLKAFNTIRVAKNVENMGRSGESCWSKYLLMKKECKKMYCVFMQVKSVLRSGWTEEDYMNHANELWSAEEKSPFDMWSCLEILQELFQLEDAGAAVINVDEEVVAPADELDECSIRKTGNKKAQLLENLKAVKEEMVKKEKSSVPDETSVQLARIANSAEKQIIVQKEQVAATERMANALMLDHATAAQREEFMAVEMEIIMLNSRKRRRELEADLAGDSRS